MLSRILLWGLLLFATPALASQGSGCLPTSGTVSGLTLVQDINAAIAAIISANSGGSAPATDCSAAPIAGQVWYNTSTKNLQLFDGTNWLSLGYLDNVNHVWSPTWGGGTGLLTAASTTDLGTMPQAIVTINGTSTIGSFGTSAPIGTMKRLVFAASLTITKSANILEPGSTSIVTQADGVAEVGYTASNVWQIFSYTPPGQSPQGPAYSFSGNNTGSSADRTDITIPGLTAKTSPTGSDLFMIADAAASNAWKKVTLSNLLSLIGGVTSINTTSGAFTTADDITTSGNVIKRNIAYSQGHLSGLILSAAGGSGTFGIAAGVATDSSNTAMMLLTSAYTKTTAAWTVGSAGGALDTGTIAASTWYAVFQIERADTGVVDACVTLTTNTACATGGAIPLAYTLQRRIGYLKTDGSSQWRKFIQNYDTFIMADLPATPDVNNATGTGSRVNITLANVPTGSVVTALMKVTMGTSGVSLGALSINSLSETDVAITSSNADLIANNGNVGGDIARLTDGLAKVSMRANNSNAVNIFVNSYGWIDSRGK